MLHTIPKSFLKSLRHLGDPWTGRRGCARGLELGLLCLCLADSPPVGRGQSAWSQLARCSSCSSLVLASPSFNPFSQLSSVAGCLVDGPPGVREEVVVRGRSEVPPRAVHYCKCSIGGLLIFFEQSTGTSQTVRRGLADSPSGARGQSARY
jgi:hypothetical protein